MSLFKRPGHEEPEVMAEINTTPLIDVMLVLLIMLIITIPPQTHAVRLEMPQGAPPPQSQEPRVVQLDIAADGGISWNGDSLAGREGLEARLAAVVTLVPQPELHIRAHADAAYGQAAMVLAEAQRLGLTRLGIVGAERFLQ